MDIFSQWIYSFVSSSCLITLFEMERAGELLFERPLQHIAALKTHILSALSTPPHTPLLSYRYSVVTAAGYDEGRNAVTRRGKKLGFSGTARAAASRRAAEAGDEIGCFRQLASVRNAEYAMRHGTDGVVISAHGL